MTFDYNYVRVCGAAAKKCYCGSPNCRGYIGGDLLGTEVVVDDDSEEEYPEPVMVHKYDETRVKFGNEICSHSAGRFKIRTSKLDEKLNEPNMAVGLVDVTTESEQSVDTVSSASAVSWLNNSLDVEDLNDNLISSKPAEMSVLTDGAKSETKSTTQKLNELSIAVGQLDIITELENSLSGTTPEVSHLYRPQDVEDLTQKSISPQPGEMPVQTDATSKASFNFQDKPIEEQTMGKVLCSAEGSPSSLTIPLLKLSSDVDANRKSKSCTSEENQVYSKSNSHMKSHHASSSAKRKQVISGKGSVLPAKPRKSLEGSSCGHFEAG